MKLIMYLCDRRIKTNYEKVLKQRIYIIINTNFSVAASIAHQ